MYRNAQTLAREEAWDIQEVHECHRMPVTVRVLRALCRGSEKRGTGGCQAVRGRSWIKLKRQGE